MSPGPPYATASGLHGTLRLPQALTYRPTASVSVAAQRTLRCTGRNLADDGGQRSLTWNRRLICAGRAGLGLLGWLHGQPPVSLRAGGVMAVTLARKSTDVSALLDT